ncbi:uncharacterized protein [Primulina huaijiensis]|uniref:uncharacterized protein n=1 Tax=Primulina huaijiensis TaxID=1492673 RepID=UPI003CC70BC2
MAWKKNISRDKPLPPSKRLRLEAQRVLKERIQDIADKKGIKLRFCTLKECANRIQSLESPCANIRMEIGWPLGVPFVHPHDLPNKAKIGLLETYEPGWSEVSNKLNETHNAISITLPFGVSVSVTIQTLKACSTSAMMIIYWPCYAIQMLIRTRTWLFYSLGHHSDTAWHQLYARAEAAFSSPGIEYM